MKKLFLLLFLVPVLLFSGCAMTVPLNPSLLMLLRDDAPAPTLNIVPKANNPAPTYSTPAEIARDKAASLS